MNAIVSIIGKDRVGIIARISNEMANANANIIDISQTTRRGIFTMMMFVDVENITIACDEKDAMCTLERAYHAAAAERSNNEEDEPPREDPRKKKKQLLPVARPRTLGSAPGDWALPPIT